MVNYKQKREWGMEKDLDYYKIGSGRKEWKGRSLKG